MEHVLEKPASVVIPRLALSYSSLKLLLEDPAAFYTQYILGNKEEKSAAYLTRGQAIHALLLEEEEFKKKFHIAPRQLPSDSVRGVIDTVFEYHRQQSGGDMSDYFMRELDHYQDRILEVLQEVNLYQSLKTDQQRIDKVITPEGKKYWMLRQVQSHKTILDAASFEFCQQVVSRLRTDSAIRELLGLDISEFTSEQQVYREKALGVLYLDYEFDLKGIVDNYVICHRTKTIRITDVKTTSRSLEEFPQAVERYRYWLQASIYCRLVGHHHQDLIRQQYALELSFLVIDGKGRHYPFRVSPATMSEWDRRTGEAFEQAAYHLSTGSFELPYEFAQGKVFL